MLIWNQTTQFHFDIKIIYSLNQFEDIDRLQQKTLTPVSKSPEFLYRIVLVRLRNIGHVIKVTHRK